MSSFFVTVRFTPRRRERKGTAYKYVVNARSARKAVARVKENFQDDPRRMLDNITVAKQQEGGMVLMMTYTFE